VLKAIRRSESNVWHQNCRLKHDRLKRGEIHRSWSKHFQIEWTRALFHDRKRRTQSRKADPRVSVSCWIRKSALANRSTSRNQDTRLRRSGFAANSGKFPAKGNFEVWTDTTQLELTRVTRQNREHSCPKLYPDFPRRSASAISNKLDLI